MPIVLWYVKQKKFAIYINFQRLLSIFSGFKLKNSILIGHSDGGTIALLFATRFPTQALVTEAAHVFVEPVTIKGIKKALIYKDILIEKLTRYHGEKTETLFFAWSDTWLEPAFQQWNIESFLSKIKCPALIIQGKNDEYATEKQVEHIVHSIGDNAKAVLIENCGHTPHKEAENIVLNKIQEFFNGIKD